MSGDGTSSIRVIPFGGKTTEWSVWAEKFLARGRKKGYKDILLGKTNVPSAIDADDDEVTLSEEDKKTRELNEEAYIDLVLSINGETEAGRVAFQMVKGAKTRELPDGDSHLAWQRLREKYEPTTTVSRLSLMKEFQAKILKNVKQDPDVWITELEDLRSRINDATENKTQFKSEIDVLEHVLNNVPADYDVTIESLLDRVGAATNPLTITELRTKLRNRFKKLNPSQSSKNDYNEGETALFAGGFKGKCNNCGKMGHKARDCRDKKDGKKAGNKKKRFDGECHYCHKPGHMAKDCFKKKRDAEEKGEKANSARDKKDKDDGDVALTHIDFGSEDENEPENEEVSWCKECTAYDMDLTFDGPVEGSEWIKLRCEREDWICPSCHTGCDSLSDLESLSVKIDNNNNIGHDFENYEIEKLNQESDDVDDERNKNNLGNDEVLYFEARTYEELCMMTKDDDKEIKGTKRNWSNMGPEEEEELLPAETEGPFEQYKWASEEWYTHNPCFHLGMTKYEWKKVPDPEETKPRHYTADWHGETYDPPCGWQTDRENYYEAMGKWKKTMLEKIQGMSEEELTLWKKCYHGLQVPRPFIARPKLDNAETALKLVDDEKIEDEFDGFFIADSGATAHMTGNDQGMFDCVNIKEKIKVGNGAYIVATKKGKLRGEINLDDGSTKTIVLHDVMYSPDLAPASLFSITYALSNGWKIGNKGTTIFLEKNDFVLKFDKIIKTKRGYICGVQIHPILNDNVATPAIERGKKMNIKLFHDTMGHVSEAGTKNTAKYYGVNLLGDLGVCSDCARAKARQKNVPKGKDTVRATIKGRRLLFDISSIKTTSYGGAKFWLLVMDDKTGKTWSYFLKAKSELKNKLISLIRHLKMKYGIEVKQLRCDNAGENIKAQEEAEKQGLGLEFEFTAPDTPQQNGRVERKFATLYGRVRAMLNRAQVTPNMRSKLWAEAAKSAEDVENLSVAPGESEPPHKQFFGEDAKHFWFLRRFGEVGIAKKGPSIKSKMTNPGIPVMFLSHAVDHTSDVYRVMNLETMRVVNTRDVRWLNQNFREYKIKQGDWNTDDDEDDEEILLDDEEFIEEEDNIDIIPEDVKLNEENVNTQVARRPQTRSSGQVTWADVARRGSRRSSPPPTGRAGRTQESMLPPTVTPKTIRVLRQLEDAWSPATALRKEAEQQLARFDESNIETIDDDAQSGREGDESSAEYTAYASGAIFSAIDHLFGEFALFVRDNSLRNHEIELERSQLDSVDERMKKKVADSKMHIVDLLDSTIKNEERMSEPERLAQLKHVVSKLKEDLPETFREAYDHPDEKLRKKWRDGIKKEFKDMINRGVWRNIKRSEVPKNRRCIKSRWVFDVKRNGIFRPRLVACGYSQVPGVDFTESYAPVINDITWRILIVAKIIWKLAAMIIDVETAFLHGDLMEEIYMEGPEGLGLSKETECVLLLKSIYGLVQASRMYFLFFTKLLREIGFVGGYADPCMMMRRDDNGVVFIAIWVDDSLLVGHDKAIQQVVIDLKKKGLTLKIEGELDDYLSCEISFSRDGKRGWIHQPHLIKKIDKKFGSMVKRLQRYRTPGTPGGSILRNTEAKITPEQHKIYRSGVGMLLYLVKHSRPDIANAVRELSKALDGTSPAAYKELMRVLKFVMDTKQLSLKIEPKIGTDTSDWNIVAFSDSDYAGDSETRISVAGFVLYLLEVPISWKSKGQKGVTLSSSEAEFVALSEAAKEVKFVYQVLTSMGVKVTLPIVVRVDNVGAIFIGSNVAVSQRSKHIDIRYHFVREFVHDGFIKIVFVKTAHNDADIFTKNLSGELHDRHSSKLVEEKRDN